MTTAPPAHAALASRAPICIFSVAHETPPTATVIGALTPDP
jgi:hypothetical protein